MAGTQVIKGAAVTSIAIGSIIGSATEGSVLFAGVGGALSQDNANFFWDDTNNRLGIGTSTPTCKLNIVDTFVGGVSGSIQLKETGANNTLGIFALESGYSTGGMSLQINTTNFMTARLGNVLFGNGITGNLMTASVGIRGNGSTSATTALLVQNSASTQLLKIGNGGLADFGAGAGGGGTGVNSGTFRGSYFNSYGDGYTIFETSNSNGNAYFYQNVSIGSGATPVASAKLELVSTTKGFLPPRMTTAQKNAIVSPAAGLMVYDTDLNKLAVFTTAWETITSL